MPQKVDIPERYLPDSDSEEDLTEEEKIQRKEKSNSIRRMLAAHRYVVHGCTKERVPSYVTPFM